MKIVVVGAGPGGYVAALRAARRGASVTLVEKGRLGGTCLQKGCIPTKTLAATAQVARIVRRAGEFGLRVSGEMEIDPRSVRDRVRRVVSIQEKGIGNLLASWGVSVVQGTARLETGGTVVVEKPDGSRERLPADRVILATGSLPARVPGTDADGERILDSDSVANLDWIPERFLIIGGGVIGCEFASIYQALGARVFVTEAMDRILPNEDEEVSSLLTKEYKKQGIEIETGVTIKTAVRDGEAVRVEYGGGRRETYDAVAVVVGRRPNTDALGLSDAGVKTGSRKEVLVDGSMRTATEGIYAVGDMTGGMLLAHLASHQGMTAADHAVTGREEPAARAVPAGIFTYPEIGRVGMTEQEARKAFTEIRVGRFQFRGLGKSHAVGEIVGMAKVVAKEKGEIVGAHIVGAEAADLIHEFSLAIDRRMTLDELGGVIHVHPTLSEIAGEASLAGVGMAIHAPRG